MPFLPFPFTSSSPRPSRACRGAKSISAPVESYSGGKSPQRETKRRFQASRGTPGPRERFSGVHQGAASCRRQPRAVARRGNPRRPPAVPALGGDVSRRAEAFYVFRAQPSCSQPRRAAPSPAIHPRPSPEDPTPDLQLGRGNSAAVLSGPSLGARLQGVLSAPGRRSSPLVRLCGRAEVRAPPGVTFP